MRATVFPSLAELRRDRLGGRAATFLLVVLLHVLLVAIFVLLSPVREMLPPAPKVFELLPPSLQPAPKPAPKPATKAKARTKTKAAAAAQAPKPVTEPQPKLFDKLLLDGFDLAKLPKGRPDTAIAEADAGDSSSAYGPGEGPGGVRLYNAEWQREPTHAELSYYLPRGAPPGSWALIACRTIPRFQVEDCVQLGESPVGSGLARAMINAAWQFRVKPPRLNSQPQVGEWVKIRFDFSKDADAGSGN
jgi:protein TonB